MAGHAGRVVRYSLSEVSAGSYLEPLLRYDYGFAGPSTKNISNLQFAPTFNVGLPNDWFVTLFPSPDIRVNFGILPPARRGGCFCHSTPESDAS